MNEVSGLCDQAVKDARLLVCTPIALVHAPFRTLRPGQSPCTGDCPSPVSDRGSRVALRAVPQTRHQSHLGRNSLPGRATHVPGVAARRSGAPSRGASGAYVSCSLATLLTVVGVFAIWANRQVLDANNWSNTSTELLQNGAIRTQMAGYLVQQLYANVDVSAKLSNALPPRLQPLAGPIAGAWKTSPRRRLSPSWAAAGAERLAHGQPADRTAVHQHRRGQLEGRQLNGNAVFIDFGRSSVELTNLSACRPRCRQAAAERRRLKVMTSNQISTVQNAVKIAQGPGGDPSAGRVPAVRARYLPVRGRRRHALFVAGSTS